MKNNLILASSSLTRKKLLLNANIKFSTIKPNVDENQIKTSCIKENKEFSKISETLAAAKAKKVSENRQNCTIIGCDQLLIHNYNILSKVNSEGDVLKRLYLLNNRQHDLFTSVVVYKNRKLIWKKTNHASLKMKNNDKHYLNDYVKRNYNEIVNSPGCYMIEEEGVRLFEYIKGDYFSILGIPLIDLLNFLFLNGDIK